MYIYFLWSNLHYSHSGDPFSFNASNFSCFPVVFIDSVETFKPDGWLFRFIAGISNKGCELHTPSSSHSSCIDIGQYMCCCWCIVKQDVKQGGPHTAGKMQILPITLWCELYISQGISRRWGWTGQLPGGWSDGGRWSTGVKLTW